MDVPQFLATVDARGGGLPNLRLTAFHSDSVYSWTNWNSAEKLDKICVGYECQATGEFEKWYEHADVLTEVEV